MGYLEDLKNINTYKKYIISDILNHRNIEKYKNPIYYGENKNIENIDLLNHLGDNGYYVLDVEAQKIEEYEEHKLTTYVVNVKKDGVVETIYVRDDYTKDTTTTIEGHIFTVTSYENEMKAQQELKEKIMNLSKELNISEEIATLILNQPEDSAIEEFKYIKYVSERGFNFRENINYYDFDYALRDGKNSEKRQIIQEILGKDDCVDFIKNLSNGDVDKLSMYVYNQNLKHEKHINDLIENNNIVDVVKLIKNGEFINLEQVEASLYKTMDNNDKVLFQELFQSIVEQQGYGSQVMNRENIPEFKKSSVRDGVSELITNYLFEHSSAFVREKGKDYRNSFHKTNNFDGERIDISKLVDRIVIAKGHEYSGISQDELNEKISGELVQDAYSWG